jgi:two-component system sensor histidine kinase/response regulator
MTTLDADDAHPSALIDKTALLERFEGDGDLLREIVGLFLEECPRRLADMRDALGRGDSDALQQAAHSIKGSVGNFNAEAAVEAALQLEMMSQAGDMARLDEACAALERELSRLTTALANLV